MTIERFQLPVGEIVADVIRKDIRNLHIGVYPPEGAVRVAAPAVMDRAAIHNAVVQRLPWIKRQVQAFEGQPREGRRTFLAGETHWFMGRRYRLGVAGHKRASKVAVQGGYLNVQVRGEVEEKKVERCLDRWRRAELTARVRPLVEAWSHKLGVQPPQIGIRRMYTRWGSCSQIAPRIWLNLALSRTPVRCIEYVVVHELAHLLVPNHDVNFTTLMDRHLPDWRASRVLLAELPYTS
jgi:predicted metal-dependent hydrolase